MFTSFKTKFRFPPLSWYALQSSSSSSSSGSSSSTAVAVAIAVAAAVGVAVTVAVGVAVGVGVVVRGSMGADDRIIIKYTSAAGGRVV